VELYNAVYRYVASNSDNADPSDIVSDTYTLLGYYADEYQHRAATNRRSVMGLRMFVTVRVHNLYRYTEV